MKSKKILVVGGTGFVGGYTSLHLQDLGYDVTLLSRSRPKGTSRLNDLPFIQGNYIEDDFNDGRLEGFDGLVFCAGNDLGNIPADGSVSQAEHFEKSNTIAIPRFFEQARKAGIARAVYMSSFYSFVAPDSAEQIPYVRSRHLADKAVRALSSDSFNVSSCALPWILGYIPGFPHPHWSGFTEYVRGRLGNAPEFAPPGGANFMTCQSVAEAMAGALERGESGKSYLIGDVSLTWQEFFELWFKAAGRPRRLEVIDADHPLIPREVIAYLGDRTPRYQPAPEETQLLGYQRGVLLPMIEESFHHYAGI